MKIKLLFTALMLIFYGFALGQDGKPIRAKVNIGNPDIKAFYDAAIAVSSQERRTLMTLKRKIKMARTDAERRHYSWSNIVFKRGYALAKEVKKTKGRMSTVQYTNFQKKLKDIDAELDKIAGSGTSASGDPAPGTFGGCLKSCNDLSPGWGKGKGFKRFGCKAGCVLKQLPFPGN